MGNQSTNQACDIPLPMRWPRSEWGLQLIGGPGGIPLKGLARVEAFTVNSRYSDILGSK